jgi:cytochrome c oxidase subunit IV
MARLDPEIRAYLLTFLALLVLLGATIGVAYIDLGVFSPIAALTIATGKAVLIILFFMHLRHSPKVTWVFALLSLLWLLILIGIVMADYIARG